MRLRVYHLRLLAVQISSHLLERSTVKALTRDSAVAHDSRTIVSSPPVLLVDVPFRHDEAHVLHDYVPVFEVLAGEAAHLWWQTFSECQIDTNSNNSIMNTYLAAQRRAEVVMRDGLDHHGRRQPGHGTTRSQTRRRR